jgi:hypothetical protein
MDYNTIQKLRTQKNLHFFTFYARMDKQVEAFIRPGNISAEDVTVTLQEIDYDVIVKHMTAKRPTPEGGITHISIPLFLVTLARNKTTPEVFKLTGLCNIATRRPKFTHPKTDLHDTTIVSVLATSERTTDSLHAACGVEWSLPS